MVFPIGAYKAHARAIMQNSLKFLVIYPSQIACGTFGGNIVDSVGMRGHLVGIGRQSRVDKLLGHWVQVVTNKRDGLLV